MKVINVCCRKGSAALLKGSWEVFIRLDLPRYTLSLEAPYIRSTVPMTPHFWGAPDGTVSCTRCDEDDDDGSFLHM